MFRITHTGKSVNFPVTPATSYHEIKPSPYVQGHNHAPPNSGSVFQIAEALAKVTQLQRLPQAKPDVFTGNESGTKFFIWETAFEFAPISAQQKMYLLYRPAIIATDFENKLANWPKIGNNDAWWKSSQLDLNKMVHNRANPTTKERLRRIPDLCWVCRRSNLPCRSHEHSTHFSPDSQRPNAKFTWYILTTWPSAT